MIKPGQYQLINMKGIESRARDAGGIGNCLNRYVGKTTWAVLDAITRAIANPGTFHDVNDPDVSTTYQRRSLQAIVLQRIQELGLTDMQVRSTSVGGDAKVQVRSLFAEVMFPPMPPVRGGPRQ